MLGLLPPQEGEISFCAYNTGVGWRNIVEKIGNTDHLSFIALGMPGFNTIQDYVGYDTRMHHTNMDFYERVKPEELKQAAVTLASFAYQAAMRPEKFPRASVVP